MLLSSQLSIVIPVLNERDNVAPMVERVRSALPFDGWELIFVDDDSSDGTADEVRRVALGEPRVRLILRVADPGLANSAVQGLLSGAADILCVMDGDGQHDPVYIARMLEVLQRDKADLVSASRSVQELAGGDALAGKRHLLSRAGNALIRLATGRDTQDPLTGFFVIRRAAFLSVVRHLSNSGFKLLFDILATGTQLRHVEMPFEFKARNAGSSKLGPLVLWQFALLLLEKLTHGWLPARVASFLVVGSTGLIVHMAVLYSLLGGGAAFSTAQTGAALTAMTFNFTLNNWLTFHDRRFRGWGLVYGWLAYLLICSVGLAANVSVASWVYLQLHWFAMFAALAGIAMDVLWKFVISDRLLWRRVVKPAAA